MNTKTIAQNILSNPKDFTAEEIEKYFEDYARFRNEKAVISPELENKKLFGIVHGERVDKVKDLTIDNFEKIDFIGVSVNVKKKKKAFYHALGKTGGRLYFLIFE